MAIILEFRATRHDVARDRRRRSHSAEIVIFPGVRYEHWGDAAPQRADPQPKATLRDVLKLVE